MSITILKAEGPASSEGYNESVVVTDIEGEPTLKWMQAQVGGWIELLRLSDNSQMIINEEGKLKDLLFNQAATTIWQKQIGPVDIIVGDAIILTAPNLLT